MKTLYLLLILTLALGQTSRAQDTVRVNVLGKNMVTVIDNGVKTDVKIGDNTINVQQGKSDSVKIRLGRKTMVFTGGKHGTKVAFDNLDDEKYKKWTGHAPKFKGHWSPLELGINTFSTVDYKGYATKNFMDLNQNKSMEVNINLFKYGIALQENKNNIGLVTGLGFNFNDYRFANNFTLKNEMGYIVPVLITDPKLEKTKLSTGFLTVPLLLEIHFPRESKLWMSMGVIGGIKMGSHTKLKIDGAKTKDHNDFDINPFRGGSTVRLGYKNFYLYGTYNFTPFFRDGRGPVMDPYTIGIGI